MLALRLIAAAVVLVALVTGAWLYTRHHHTTSDFADHSTRLITVGSSTLEAEVVSTDASRQQGLSGRAGLPPGTAMLFVFDADGAWGFWMKDMNFSIDIVWANAEGDIITIDPDVSPNTYPRVFYPLAPARYVVELPAGFAGSHGLAVGQRIGL